MVRPLGSEAACQFPALVEGEARAAGRDDVADLVERDAAGGQGLGEGRFGDGGLGDDEGVGLEDGLRAGQRRARRSRRPRASR